MRTRGQERGEILSYILTDNSGLLPGHKYELLAQVQQFGRRSYCTFLIVVFLFFTILDIEMAWKCIVLPFYLIGIVTQRTRGAILIGYDGVGIRTSGEGQSGV